MNRFLLVFHFYNRDAHSYLSLIQPNVKNASLYSSSDLPHARTHTPAYTSIVGTRIIKYMERVTWEWMIRSRDWCFLRDSSDYVFYFDRRLLRITWMIVKLEIVANHKRPACITYRIAEHDHHRVTARVLSIKNILFNRSSLIEALRTESFAFLPKKNRGFASELVDKCSSLLYEVE